MCITANSYIYKNRYKSAVHIIFWLTVLFGGNRWTWLTSLHTQQSAKRDPFITRWKRDTADGSIFIPPSWRCFWGLAAKSVLPIRVINKAVCIWVCLSDTHLPSEIKTRRQAKHELETIQKTHYDLTSESEETGQWYRRESHRSWPLMIMRLLN